MHTCPDCEWVETQIEGKSGYEIIDIGGHVKNLKAFLRLRDSDPDFDKAKRSCAIGIPGFVLEDGKVTLIPEDAGLHSRKTGDGQFSEGASCSIDGNGC